MREEKPALELPENVSLWEAEKIVLIPDPLTSYAVGRTAREAQSLAGRHANHMLFLADEASIIKKEIFEAIEGCLTSGAENRFAMIGNPTQINGYFFAVFLIGFVDTSFLVSTGFSSCATPSVTTFFACPRFSGTWLLSAFEPRYFGFGTIALLLSFIEV